jgi:hypothetical protein
LEHTLAQLVDLAVTAVTVEVAQLFIALTGLLQQRVSVEQRAVQLVEAMATLVVAPKVV